LPIVAIALEIVSIIVQLTSYWVEFEIVFEILGLLYFAPFLLFILFCPPTHKRIKISNVNPHLQEQELEMLYLKNEFESGGITQQEYDHKRKALLDKL
jgi:uncharacterized membrane protein